MAMVIDPSSVEVVTTSGTSAQFAAVGSASNKDTYRFCCGAASFILAGTNPTATTSHTFVAAGQEVFIVLTEGMKLAVVQDTAADTASLTKVTFV